MSPSTSEMLPITFFEPDLSHSIETMVWFLVEDPQRKVRVVTSLARSPDGSEHPWCVQRLQASDRIEMVDLSAAAQPSSLLVFNLACRKPFHPSFRPWLARANTAAFRPEPDFYASRADWAREWLRSFPCFLRARIAILERASSPADLRFGHVRHIRYARTVHPQFIALPRYRAAMFGSVASEQRRFRVVYLGNRQPAPRAERLDAMQRALQADARVRITDRYSSPAGSGMEALWIEYGAEGSARGLEPEVYTAALAEADFCLSPPGWSRWAHRTIEALVRGCIPVLENPSLYAHDLRDGENCLVVANHDWEKAVQRCLSMSLEEIAAMRQRVLELRTTSLLPEITARQFRKDLLLEEVRT
jgi:hypothetical protein